MPFFIRSSKAQDYSLVKYSVTHFLDFVQGFKQVIGVFAGAKTPKFLQTHAWAHKNVNRKARYTTMMKFDKKDKLSVNNYLVFGFFLRNHFKEMRLNWSIYTASSMHTIAWHCM